MMRPHDRKPCQESVRGTTGRPRQRFGRLPSGVAAALAALLLTVASTSGAEPPARDAAGFRELSMSYSTLADEYLRTGDVATARAWLEKSVQIDTELLTTARDNETAQRDLSVSTEQLGDVLRQMNELAGARRLYEQSRDLREKLAKRRSPPDLQSLRDLSISLERLGVVHRLTGELALAEASLQSAFRIRQQIVDAVPASAMAQRELSVTLVLLGDVQMSRGRTDEARTWFERSLKLDQNLWEANRADVTAARDLSISHERLGDWHLRLAEGADAGDHATQARRHFEQSARLREAVAAASGNSIAARRDLALALNRVGEACLKLNELTAARQSFEQALAVRRKLAMGDAATRDTRRDLLRAYEKVGRLSLQLGFTDRARENFEQARQLAESLRRESDDLDGQADWAGVAGYLGDVAMQAEDFSAATRWFEQGIAVLGRLTADAAASPSSIRWRDWLDRQRDQLAKCRQAERALKDLNDVVALATSTPRRAAELMRIRARDQARRGVPADSADTIRTAIERTDAKLRERIARWLSQAAAAVGEPTEKLNPPDVIERRKYVDLAIEVLREIRTQPDGPARLKTLDAEADLAPLRSDKRFQDLLKSAP